MGLFTIDHTRYRFITDFQFSVQQIAPNIKRAFFIYKPEEPEHILGKKILLLEQIDKCGFNYKDFVGPSGFKPLKRNYKLLLKVFLNGIEATSVESPPLRGKTLTSGQITLDVKQAFENIQQIYQSRTQ